MQRIIFFASLWLISDTSPSTAFDCDTSLQLINGTLGTIGTSGIRGAPDLGTGLYPKKAFCIWDSDLPEGKFVTFRFVWLDVELMNDCLGDRVEIYSTGDTYEAFCGRGEQPLPPEVTISTDEKVYVNFISDDIFEFKGFELEYQVTDHHPCSPEKGWFQCTNRHCVQSNSTCNGSDDCGDASDEQGCPGTKMDAPSKCGMPVFQRDLGEERIVGGRVAVPGSWPWQISLQNSYSYPSGHFCGGSLINNLWIVTASHCLVGKSVSQLKVELGSHRRFVRDPAELSRTVSKTCLHPHYDNQLLENDIALLRLNTPVRYSRHVQPVCLPTKDEELQARSKVYVTGWGRTQGTGGHDFLKEAEIPVIGREACQAMPRPIPLFRNTICLGYPNGNDAPCFGDSGGPVVQRSNTTDQWRLYGLVSSGPRICGVKFEPNLCTKVSSYVDWIRETMERFEAGETPDCRF